MNPTAETISPSGRLETDTLVVGAGQAALALGYYLRDLPQSFLLVDRHARIGDSWRNRYDSLRLFTPRRYSALPGRPVAGDPDGLPTKDEIADYLEDYARHFAFPVLPRSSIQSLKRVFDRFHATTFDGRVIESRAVVLANGAFQKPAVPALAAGLSRSVRQISSSEYRRPAQVPAGNVLVVGDGATGRQIALELAATHRTFLASGHARRIIPERLLGRSIFWWMRRGGMLTATRESLRGRYLRWADPLPGRHLTPRNLARQGVTIVPRLAELGGATARFTDGREVEVQSVIWATGYREDTSWVHIPEVLDPSHQLIHQRGVTPVKGLYVLGRNWQSSRGSSLLLGVAADARYIAEHLAAPAALAATQKEYPKARQEPWRSPSPTISSVTL